MKKGIKIFICFFFSSRRRHTRYIGDWFRRVLFRSTHGVADHVLEGAAQELRIARQGELAVRRQLNLTAARSRLDRNVGGNRLQQLADIDARLLERVPGTLEARELQRARNELLEPLGLAGDAREVALHSGWLAARERERELQPSERRAKLVGHIPQQLLLRLEE